MQVSVRFFTVLREITGKREETAQFAEAEKVTVGSVLKALSNRYGKQFSDYIYNSNGDEVKGFLQFFVNGQSASGLNGLETEVHNGDVLAIVPPVGGG
ncbi:MAG: MoaD family protein [Candidatus Bathyarchaeota archaeon]|nr:MoaD family protein [Candidatus Bathyarchaeota archaeon]